MRIIQISFLIFGFLTVSRCTTVSEISEVGLRAPSTSKAATHSRKNDHATSILNRYRESQHMAQSGRSDEACAGFQTIAIDSAIPEAVRFLTQVRAAAVCAPKAQINLPSPAPKWLSEEIAKSRLVIAERTSDLVSQADTLIELASFEKTQKLRIERVKRSLDILNGLTEAVKKTEAAWKVRQRAFAKLVEFAPRYYLQHRDAVPIAPSLLSLANDLRSAREFEEARQIYKRIASDKRQAPEERLMALDGLRLTYKLQLRTEEFLNASRTWLNFAKTHFLKPGLKRRDPNLIRIFVDTGVLYARAIWTDHRPSYALQFLEDLESTVSQALPAFSMHESALVRARIAEERGDFEKMHAILSKLDISRLPDRATTAKILWFLGWNQRRLPGQQEAALATLEEANRFEESHGSRTRNMYWIARLKRDIGRQDEANKLFEELAEVSHFGYYGILAHHELGKSFDPLPDPHNFYDPRSRSPLPDDLRVPIDWFIALGELEVGRKFLEAYPLNEVWSSSHSIQRKEAQLQLMARLELFIQATIRMEELAPEERVRILRKSPWLLFPLPFEARIRGEASKQGLDPALIYSIIRQESLFNTFARSHADAFGLMQLIPEVATVASGRLGLSLSSPDDLYDPDVNIQLGSVFLKYLFQRYGGRFVLSVAAYNANDRAIQGWLRTRMRPDPIEFIEEIPYEETRTYVKLVLRNFVTYQRRLNNQPIKFPEWTLRINAISN